MTNNNSFEAEKNEQVSRRSFLGKGALSLGAMALAGNVFGQTKIPVAPNPDKANPNGRFAGKVVLITGATSGIGEGTAYAFAKEGAKVFFCGRRENLGKQVEAKLKSSAAKLLTLKRMFATKQRLKTLLMLA
jgi:NADPH:quinone reductase-like Zn-dependent oxidoreductase